MSFIFKTQDIDSQYKKILTTQKDLIQNNKYMRELEEKYHKSSRRYTKSLLPTKPSGEIKTHNWPIESSMFTQILKKKLESVFPLKAPIIAPLQRQSMSRPKSRASQQPSAQPVRASHSFSRRKDTMTEMSALKKIKLHKKPTSESPYSRLSLENSIDGVYEEEGREFHVIRIPRYY